MMESVLTAIQEFISRVKWILLCLLSTILCSLHWLLEILRYWLNWLLIVVLCGIPVTLYISLYLDGHFRRDQEEHYTVPYWNFILKKWWICLRLWIQSILSMSAKRTSLSFILPSQEDEQIETLHSLLREDEMESMAISGTDHKGNALYLKISRKEKVTEVFIYVQFEDGSIFLLPESPGYVLSTFNRNSWSGGGLNLQMCEPLRRWRISFNGLLRCHSWQHFKLQKKENEEDTKHIIFNFIWTTCSDMIDIQRDWSMTLKSEAIAREPWRSPMWTEMGKQIGEGYDQWGILFGQWNIVGDEKASSELYLRGIRSRRKGIDEAKYIHRSVSFSGVATNGSMFSIEAKNCRKPGLTHAVFGHFYKPNGLQVPVDFCDLSMPDLGENADLIPEHIEIIFSAGKQKYKVNINTLPHSAVTYYGGNPWDYEAHVFLFQFVLNICQGVGIAVFWYKYTGPRAVVLPELPPILNEIQHKRGTQVPLLVDFEDKLCRCSALVGGKAASLGLLTSVGIHKLPAIIPPGFCLTVESLNKQMENFRLLLGAVRSLEVVSCGNDIVLLEDQCNKTVELFESTPVCGEVNMKVSYHLEELAKSKSSHRQCAVRSSAVEEGSDALLSAGHNKTLLAVHLKISDILEAIQMCWASLYTFQSVQYRRQHGQPIQATMGVIIQLMVESHTAGDLFTCNPTSGDTRTMIISANYGLGESIAAGLVEPDIFILSRSRTGELAVTGSKPGKKTHKLFASKLGGVIAEKADNDKSTQLCLSVPEVIALGTLGFQLEQMFGSPRDIQWAISQDQIYLLQVRAITALDSWTHFELLHELDSPLITDDEVLIKGNFGEVSHGAFTPLSQSITTRSMDLITQFETSYCQGSLFSQNIITASHHIMTNYLNTLLTKVKCYDCIEDKLLDLAISGHVIVTDELLELAATRHGTLSLWSQVVYIIKILKNLMNRGRLFKMTEKLSYEYQPYLEFNSSVMSLYLGISDFLSVLAKITEYHGIATETSVFVQLFAVCILTGNKTDLTDDDLGNISLMLSKCSYAASSEIPAMLEELAADIQSSGKASVFCKVHLSEVIEWLLIHCPHVAAKLDNFLDKFGHRSVNEYELMTETWAMKPKGLMMILQTMLKNSDGFLTKIRADIPDRELLSQLKNVETIEFWMILSWLLPICHNTVADRENSKDCYMKVIQKLRFAYRQLADQMAKEGRLPDSELLFFFTHYELGVLLRTRSAALVSKAHQRRRRFSAWNELQFPEISRGVPVPLPPQNDSVLLKQETAIKGTTVCPGTVSGRAFVLIHPDDIVELEPGDILITHSTDVGWTPYFPLLAGVVTEFGGLLSHGAVVAREYGLPCIIGCKNATVIFETGLSCSLPVQGDQISQQNKRTGHFKIWDNQEKIYRTFLGLGLG